MDASIAGRTRAVPCARGGGKRELTHPVVGRTPIAPPFSKSTLPLLIILGTVRVQVASSVCDGGDRLVLGLSSRGAVGAEPGARA